MRFRTSMVATLSVVTALALVPAVSATAATPHLRGVVTSGGDPVEGVCVDVHPAGSLAEQLTYTTDGAGRWRGSPSVEAPAIFGSGTYRVKVEFRDCDGATNGNVAGAWYDGARSFEAARVVTVDPGASAPVSISADLVPGSAIFGEVVDQNGTRIAGACVSASDPLSPSVGNEARTDAKGRFTVMGLPAGTYVLQGTDCQNRTQATAWLGPDGRVARGADDAQRIEVAAGASTSVDPLTLPRAGRLTGAVDLPGTDAGACVTAIDLDSNTSVGDTTGDAGQYTLGGLLPGRWLVRVADCRAGVGATDRFATVYLLPGGAPTPYPHLAEEDPFQVGSGTTTVRTRTMVVGGALAGTVFTDGGTDGVRSGAPVAPVARACVSAVPQGGLRIVASTRTGGDGSYVLGGLHPDADYHLAAYDCGTANAHGLDWARNAPAEGQSLAYSPSAGAQRGGVDITVGDVLRRVAGNTRVDTAAELALGTFDGATTVVLARADDYPDALAGAPLATRLDAPILLTDGDDLSPVAASAIRALGARRVVMLGLEVALSERVQDQVEGIPGIESVQRLGGATRFDTAALIANAVGGDHVYVVEGASADRSRGWPDAVSVAGLAARTRAPLLLVRRDEVPTATLTALDGLDFTSVTVIGGPVAVSDPVYEQLAARSNTIERLAGGTRYGTSAAVVQRALDLGMWSRTTWVATGLNYPDALVAGAVIGQDGGILQLVHGHDAAASPEALTTVEELSAGIDRVVFLGGTAAISGDTAAAVAGRVGTR